MVKKAGWTSCRVMASLWAVLAQKDPEIRAHNSAYRPTLRHRFDVILPNAELKSVI